MTEICAINRNNVFFFRHSATIFAYNSWKGWIISLHFGGVSVMYNQNQAVFAPGLSRRNQLGASLNLTLPLRIIAITLLHLQRP
ncbi:hypothetical protein V1521DRAFT_422797 [Lipomyces starkeyi]